MNVDRPMLPAPDDGTVIALSLADGNEFAAIFDRHAAAVHRYLARRIGRTIADDLTGETFLVAFRQRRRYDAAKPDALPWLYGIATNILHRHRRTELRQYRAFARTGIDPDGDSGGADHIVARVAATSANRRLAGLLAKLPAGQRDVLLLVAREGLDYVAVAQALDIPVGTVRSRLHTARKRLRAALSDLDPTMAFDEDGGR